MNINQNNPPTPPEQPHPDNQALPLSELFCAAREWPEQIIVEPSRLAMGLWGDGEGDISAAYCAETFPTIRTFVHDGQRFTNLGGTECSMHCHPLLLPEEYKGTGKQPYSRESETVTYEKRTFVLGQKIIFASRPLTVDEEISLLQRKYAYGGHFVSGKTYQEMLLMFREDDRNSEGLKTAIERELARKEFPKTQPEMLAELGKLPDAAHETAGVSQLGLPGM